MIEIRGNIWDFHDRGNWIVITTNGFVKKSGAAVMGRGLALQAANRFPSLPKRLGESLLRGNTSLIGGVVPSWLNIPHDFPDLRLISFPVKNFWGDIANLELIEHNLPKLSILVRHLEQDQDLKPPVYVTRFGTGNGERNWSEVKPLMEKYLDERFVICDLQL